jgi:hypothetical protein
MQPNRLGRILGIGARVAADELRKRTAQATSTTTAPVPRPSPSPSIPRPSVASAPPSAASKTSAPPYRPSIPSSASIATGSRRFARGAGRFGASLWHPFAHASGILWLQITGLFFAFFAVGFAAHSWQLYRSAGWRDHHLPLYIIFGVLFAWFALSSFWRANRKQKRS